jgi:hypothetical protein
LRILSAWRYAAVVLVIGAFSLVAPIPSGTVRQASLTAVRSSSSIAILGPSVVRHTSACDRDHRNLAEMLAASSDRSVNDLSYPGQPLTEAVHLAALEATYGRSTDVVLTVAYDGLSGWPTIPYRDTIFFRLVNPSFALPIDVRMPGAWEGFLDRPRPAELGFEYEGTIYPDQSGIHAKWFEAEKALATCPETITHDWRYLKAYTWLIWVRPQPTPTLVPMLADLDAHLRAKSKKLHVVMLPVNYQVLASFDPNWATVIRERQAREIRKLRRRGVSVLNLSDLVSSDAFSTVWCACTHLNEIGRRKVAEAISQSLSAPSEASETVVVMENSASFNPRQAN